MNKFKPTVDKMVIKQLLDSYYVGGVIVPSSTTGQTAKGRIEILDNNFNPDYSVGDIVLYFTDDQIEIQIDNSIYYIIDKFNILGVIQ